MVLALVLMATAAYAQGGEGPVETVYYGFVAGMPFSETGLEAEAPERMALVQAYGMAPTGFWIEMPEGYESAEELFGMGMRITVDEASLAEAEDMSVYQPLKIEVAGNVHYGEVLSMGEDFVEMKTISNTEDQSLESLRLTLTPETQIIFPLEVGKTYDVIYDADGVALYIIAANG